MSCHVVRDERRREVLLGVRSSFCPYVLGTSCRPERRSSLRVRSPVATPLRDPPPCVMRTSRIDFLTCVERRVPIEQGNESGREER